MSALTATMGPGSDTPSRPVPWRRMGWIVWRQHRFTVGGTLALLGALALYVLVTGLQMRDAHATAAACHPAASDVCQRAMTDFFASYSPRWAVTAGLLQLVPGLIGVFAGAPLLAREFETGTFRYAWTQGFGRVRWTVAKLAPLAVAVTGAAAAFSLLFAWAFQPLLDTPTYGPSPLEPWVFNLLGVGFAAWTLAAFAIGSLAGVLVRRVTPAMGVALAVWAALAFTTGAYLRPHYAAPLAAAGSDVEAPAWVLSRAWLQNGQPADLAMINQALRPIDVQAVTPELFQPGPATPVNADPVPYLAKHGFVHLTTYQPADRFWPFQWIEGGWLLLVSLLLLALTVWLVRRRAA